MSNPACHVTTGAKLFGLNSYTTVATLCLMNVLVLEQSVAKMGDALQSQNVERERRHRKAMNFNTQRNHADPYTARKVFQLLEETVALDEKIDKATRELQHEEQHLSDLQAMFRLVMRLFEAEEKQFPVLRLVRKRAAHRQEQLAGA